MSRIMAFHLPQWRTPWMAALLLLGFIWSLWFLAFPESAPSQSIKQIADATTPLILSQPVQPAHNTLSTKPKPTEHVVPPISEEGHSEKKNPYEEKIQDQPSDKPLILYAYSETVSARVNLKFFIAHGLHDAADFIFIFNGESDATWLIPNKTNIDIVQRENDCYDLGAYAEVLTTDNLYQQYKRFILINASVRGPFLPHWAMSCWSNMYLDKVTDRVKLVGMTGNCWPQFHVQSMIWATDRTGIDLLLNPPPPPPRPPTTTTATMKMPELMITMKPGINNCFHDWSSAVHAEIHASQIIIDAGYEVDVMMSAYHVGHYVEHCDSETNGDVLWQGKYEGTNVHPYETIFLKSNRDIDPVLMERLTSWHDRANYSSYDFCKL